MWEEINQITCGWLRLGLAALVATVALGFFAGTLYSRNTALQHTIGGHNAIIEQLCSTACSLSSKSKVLHEQVEKHEDNFKDLLSETTNLHSDIDNRYKTIIRTTSVLKLQITTLRNETKTRICGVQREVETLDSDIEHMVNCMRDLDMIDQESHLESLIY